MVSRKKELRLLVATHPSPLESEDKTTPVAAIARATFPYEAMSADPTLPVWNVVLAKALTAVAWKGNWDLLTIKDAL